MADSILYLDIETTGKAKAYDQIVQVAYAWEVDGELVDEQSVMIRPTIPISAGATAVHGITDEMVSDAPTFAEATRDLVRKIEQADIIVQYNGNRFDIPILDSDFKRAGIRIQASSKHQLDSFRLLQEMRPRKLTDMHEEFVGAPLENAHDALADVRGTHALYRAMKQHFDLESMSEREIAIRLKGNNITVDGKLLWDGDTIIWNWGQCASRPVEWVMENKARWLNWIVTERDYEKYDSITLELQEISRQALANLGNPAAFYQWIEDTYGAPPDEDDEPGSTAGVTDDSSSAPGQSSLAALGQDDDHMDALLEAHEVDLQREHEMEMMSEAEAEKQSKWLHDMQEDRDYYEIFEREHDQMNRTHEMELMRKADAVKQRREQQEMQEDYDYYQSLEREHEQMDHDHQSLLSPSEGETRHVLFIDDDGISINCQLCSGPMYSGSIFENGRWCCDIRHRPYCDHCGYEPEPDFFEGVQ